MTVMAPASLGLASAAARARGGVAATRLLYAVRLGAEHGLTVEEVLR